MGKIEEMYNSDAQKHFEEFAESFRWGDTGETLNLQKDFLDVADNFVYTDLKTFMVWTAYHDAWVKSREVFGA